MTPASSLRVGVDVGGTFTDLVAAEPDGSGLRVVKLPSTPPDFHRAVIDAVTRAARADAGTAGNAPDGGNAADLARPLSVVHGSTVATNALLQRTGRPVAFLVTEGFRDLLHIGRQNRPDLYALHVRRPAPLVLPEHCFPVRERVDAAGRVVTPLDEVEVARVVAAARAAELGHAAVCLLFSFIFPDHERRLGRALADAGLTVSLSCDVLAEFREYERASTTAINAALRPIVGDYLRALAAGLPAGVSDLRVLHGGGGTVGVAEAEAAAARLVLSGPAGGVLGAAFVATAAGFDDVITYDMGGTSTDVAVVLGGKPQWTTAATVDGLPIGLPLFDIHTVGAGGGSVASLDAGGALRVGPRSAGARPGPACYGLGGVEPTVTDANLLLGRILPDAFLGGAMRVEVDRAAEALRPLAAAMGRDVLAAALGVVRVAEANMEHALRAITSRRGHDPRRFALVSFGGAGGLHACALAEALEIPRVLVPPYCGVLSALGMVVAPPVADASRTVAHLGDALDDERLPAEFGYVSGLTIGRIPYEQTAAVEAYADVRFRGQSHEVKVRVERPSREHIEQRFREAYAALYGRAPQGRAAEIVTLRVRRVGKHPPLALPALGRGSPRGIRRQAEVVLSDGQRARAPVLARADLIGVGPAAGPLLLIDPEATTFVPLGWSTEGRADGGVVLSRR